MARARTRYFALVGTPANRMPSAAIVERLKAYPKRPPLTASG